MTRYPTYEERGLPGVQDREIRLYTCAFMDGEHTLTRYLSLYRRGELGPLRYEFHGVPIVPCRGCGVPRADDGTPCQSCGAYQHCATVDLDAAERAEAISRSTTRALGDPRKINPRRSIRNGR